MARLWSVPCPIIFTVRHRVFFSLSSSDAGTVVASSVRRDQDAVRRGRYPIPDVAVFCPVDPAGVPETPPLVAIEILSPDDRMSDVREKARRISDPGRAARVAHRPAVLGGIDSSLAASV